VVRCQDRCGAFMLVGEEAWAGNVRYRYVINMNYAERRKGEAPSGAAFDI